MAQVSALTGLQYGKDSPYFIAPTFLYKQNKGITPRIYQLEALSQVTGYRLADWMKVCGFDPKMVFPLQFKIHTERTILVTPDYGTADFGHYVDSRHSSNAESNKRYLFAKIGSCDAVVYPRVLPGSIVRVDRYCSLSALDSGHADQRLWLVAHPGGLTCCYVKRINEHRVILLPNRPPLSPWPLRLSEEARILGLVDLEFRPGRRIPQDRISQVASTPCTAPAPVCNRRTNVSNLLRSSRLRAGMTLRVAHDMTVRVARLLGNRDYGIALGLLSDYEAMNRLPRHVAKIMSLCVIYGIDLWELLEAGGIHVDDSEKAALFQDGSENELRRSAYLERAETQLCRTRRQS